MEGQKSLNVRCVKKTSWTVLDTELHVSPQRFTERMMERMAREPRRVASPKEEKVETKRKEKVKERKGNVSTKSQNLQESSG